MWSSNFWCKTGSPSPPHIWGSACRCQRRNRFFKGRSSSVDRRCRDAASVAGPRPSLLQNQSPCSQAIPMQPQPPFLTASNIHPCTLLVLRPAQFDPIAGSAPGTNQRRAARQHRHCQRACPPAPGAWCAPTQQGLSHCHTGLNHWAQEPSSSFEVTDICHGDGQCLRSSSACFEGRGEHEPVVHLLQDVSVPLGESNDGNRNADEFEGGEKKGPLESKEVYGGLCDGQGGRSGAPYMG